jgi:hypothetical protein
MSTCSCDEDRPEFYAVKMRKARVSHKCCECRRPISPGETYEHVSGKWGGYTPETFRTCPRCLALRDWVEGNLPCVCWSHGSFISDARDAVDDAIDRTSDETHGLRFGFRRRLHSVRYHGLPKYKFLRVRSNR